VSDAGRPAAWRKYSDAELDDQYNVSATVPRVEDYFERWVAESNKARASLDGELDLAYGDGERERLDLFAAAKADSPVLLFMHGGYWRRLGKEYFSFFAEPFVAAGAAVAILNYPLAPVATLDEIVRSVRSAFAWLYAHVSAANGDPNHMVASGHSAGGQLSAMLALTDWRAYGLPPDAVRGVGAISGVFDVRPLAHTHINAWLQLDPAMSARNSPIDFAPPHGVRTLAAVGGAETDEFRRQSRDFATAWTTDASPGTCVEVPGRNHFDILLGVLDPADRLRHALLELLNL
jgi:arylformamidase